MLVFYYLCFLTLFKKLLLIINYCISLSNILKCYFSYYKVFELLMHFLPVCRNLILFCFHMENHFFSITYWTLNYFPLVCNATFVTHTEHLINFHWFAVPPLSYINFLYLCTIITRYFSSLYALNILYHRHFYILYHSYFLLCKVILDFSLWFYNMKELFFSSKYSGLCYIANVINAIYYMQKIDESHKH